MKEDAGYQAARGGADGGKQRRPGRLGRQGAGSPATSERTEARQKKASVAGLTFPRFFTEAGVDPFDEVEWELRAAVIGNERGELVFEQRDVEIPKFWSQQATNIVVSKYFRGQMARPSASAASGSSSAAW